MGFHVRVSLQWPPGCTCRSARTLWPLSAQELDPRPICCALFLHSWSENCWSWSWSCMALSRPHESSVVLPCYVRYYTATATTQRHEQLAYTLKTCAKRLGTIGEIGDIAPLARARKKLFRKAAVFASRRGAFCKTAGRRLPTHKKPSPRANLQPYMRRVHASTAAIVAIAGTDGCVEEPMHHTDTAIYMASTWHGGQDAGLASYCYARIGSAVHAPNAAPLKRPVGDASLAGIDVVPANHRTVGEQPRQGVAACWFVDR